MKHFKNSFLACFVGLLSIMNAPAQPPIIKVEYFIDKDPGLGNGVPVNLTPAVNLENIIINFDPDSLSEGVHVFAIRAKDENGTWSLTNRWLFSKPFSYGANNKAVPDITQIEYFIDTDPGYGKGTPVSFTSVAEIQDVGIDISSALLTQGIHLFVCRARDANGAWSLVNRWQLTATILPVELTSFTATYNNNSTLLLWETAQEQNSSHFNIQRSTNGVTFINIGKVDASGNSSNSRRYSFIDNNALNAGMEKIFYRLEQVDLDSKTSFSKTAIVSIPGSGQRLVIMPNPVIDNIVVRLNDISFNKGASLSIFDLTGKKLFSKNISSQPASKLIPVSTAFLSSGMYLIVIESSGKRWQAKFVKQ